ncbi:hypothetical protein ACVME9_002896 [Bradyrhizobium liaoningense]
MVSSAVQHIAGSSAALLKECLIASWDRTTPFGRPVVPEV